MDKDGAISAYRFYVRIYVFLSTYKVYALAIHCMGYRIAVKIREKCLFFNSFGVLMGWWKDFIDIVRHYLEKFNNISIIIEKMYSDIMSIANNMNTISSSCENV